MHEMTWEPPKTINAWEKLLVRYFICIGPDGDASDIQSFEVTPTTLALACGAESNQEATVEEAFRSFMSQIPDLSQRLSGGMQAASTQEWPNFFVYLAMTLLIDSQLDTHDESNEFRSKLRKWLGVTNGFQQLPGVNQMWETLAQWLDLRIRNGQPFRRLILPAIPKSWRHIGYTLRLTFPNKTDLRLMEDFLTKHPQAHTDPRLLIKKFPIILLDERASDSLKLAFTEFREAYLLGRRALAGLRFWRLLHRALTRTSQSMRSSVTVEMIFDADGSRGYQSHFEQALEAEFHSSLFMALACVSAHTSLNLSVGISSGLLFFRQIGIGSWRAETSPTSAPQGLHVALARRNERYVRNRLGKLIDDGEWLLTSNPLSYQAVCDALLPTKLLPPLFSEQIVRPRLSGGIRMPHGWLARPSFLPHIESDTTDYVIHPVAANPSNVPFAIEYGQLTAPDQFEGSFLVEPAREIGEKKSPWRLHVQFFQNALPHHELGRSARYRLEPLTDWYHLSPTRVTFEGHDTLTWETDSVDCEHLLEALYASGAYGWEEAELVTILRRTNASPWTLLLCLRDAGIVEPRLRSGWKGRSWTLVEPRLIRIAHSGRDLVVLEGALCNQLVKDFRKAVEGLGGQCFRRLGVSPWSPPLIGAKLVAVDALAKILGWPLITEPLMPDELPMALARTERMETLHEIVSTWDWSCGGFRDSPARHNAITLTRRVHPGGRDHDLYCLTTRHSTTNWHSRTAAIVAAHAQNRTPLFEQRESGQLMCLTRDGGLPDALAIGLKRRMLRNGGPVGTEYVYPVDTLSLKWLKSLLPKYLFGPVRANNLSLNGIISEARRSGGQQRLQWRNGQLTLMRHD